MNCATSEFQGWFNSLAPHESKMALVFLPLRCKHIIKQTNKSKIPWGSESLSNLFLDFEACMEYGAHCSVSKSDPLPWKVFGLREDSSLRYLSVCTGFFVHSRHSASADLILGLKMKLKWSYLGLFGFVLSLAFSCVKFNWIWTRLHCSGSGQCPEPR